ncbi:MAG: efflux RND transporter periplasmic adaptor subunit [Clostridia bacterium]|nr:efflux RND transporter periplasmic adaptor subunit [Clostridia bacterium]
MIKYNKKFFVLFIIVIAMIVVGWHKNNRLKNGEDLGNILKPVKVTESQYEMVTTELDYIGVVNAEDFVKYASEVPGKINQIYVKKNQHVKAGEALFEVDRSNVSLLLESADLKLEQSLQAMENAKDNKDLLKTKLDRLSKLYEEGAIDKSSYEDIEFKFNTALRNFEKAKTSYELAKVNLNKNQKDFNNTIINAKKDGVVADIVMREGEIIDSGMPVIVMRDELKVLNIGVSANDLKHIKIGDTSNVSIDNIQSKGTVREINELPDKSTRLYTVEIALENEDYMIGEIGTITFEIDKKRGVKVPISAIGTKDYDYVFIEADGKAKEQRIKILGTYKEFVLIDGVKEEDKIIIEGMRALNDGDLINIIPGGN